MVLLRTTRLLVFQEKFQTTYNIFRKSIFLLVCWSKTQSLRGKIIIIFVETILVKLKLFTLNLDPHLLHDFEISTPHAYLGPYDY